MSGVHWTERQRQAIEARGADLLVSAGAGAGKTAVLVERIFRRITDPDDPVDVDRLLVVTFTEAAAAEMRQRIARRLAERLAEDPGDQRLAVQAALLPRAQISTLHAFCLRVCRLQFHLAGMDPSFRVLDEDEAQLLRYETVDQILERRFAAGDEDFLDLARRFGGRTGQGLANLILRVHEFAATQVDPDGWLDRALALLAPPEVEQRDAGQDAGVGAAQRDGPAAGHPLLDEARAAAAVRVEQALWRIRHAQALASLPDGPAGYLDRLAEDAAMLEHLVHCLKNRPWDEAAAALRAAAFKSLPRSGQDAAAELKDQVRGLRDKAKEMIRSLQQSVLARPLARQAADLAAVRRSAAVLVDLVREFDAAYRAAKEALAAADFNDLERGCLRVLEAGGDPGDFAEIVVDEYQDINPVQDAILERLAALGQGRRRFMVGDLKQSIYRFRLADPTIFLKRHRTYRPEAGAEERRIDLPENFRSRASVLDAVNFVFAQLFPTGVGGVPYGEEAALKPGLPYPPPEAAVEVHILERDPGLLREAAKALRERDPNPQAGAGDAGGAGRREDSPPGEDSPQVTGENLRSEEREAALAARLIARMLGLDGRRPDRVWDPRSEAWRDLAPGDVAILLRSPRYRAAAFVEALTAAGIPARADLRTGYLDSLEVSTVLSLLQVLDNPRQDIPLAAVLHSPLVGLDAAGLARVRLAAPDGDFYDACRAAGIEAVDRFLERMERWRTAARRGPLGDLLWRIYQETGFLEYAGGMPGGAQRRANLERLLELARAFDGFARQGLHRFLRFVERLKERQADVGTVTPAASAGDAVQVLSIHQSKGLEFPVVLVADLGREFNRDDLGAPVLLHRDLGLAPRLVDPQRGTRSDPAAREALKHRLWAESLAEEMRVLYVAMTRARERLILLGSVRDVPSALQRWCSLVQHPETPLPDGYLLEASSFLDLLGPCLARHRHGAPLRQAAPAALLPAHRRLFDDPSRWDVHVWRAEQAVRLVPPSPAQEGGLDGVWDRLCRGEPVDLPRDGDGAERAREAERDLDRRLQWSPPWAPLGRLPAKTSVTELKAAAGRDAAAAAAASEPEASPEASPEAAGEEEPAAQWLPPAPWQAELPRIDLGGDGGPPAAGARRRGTVTHLILQHLDLSRPLDAAGIAAQVKGLVARQVLSPGDADLVPVRRLARFFASPLGRRMRSAAGLRREVPFLMRLPAAEVHGDAAAAPELQTALQSEWVLVQGVVDALWREPHGLVLVDFKTDRVTGDAAALAAERGYDRQLRMYARAVAAAYGEPAAEAYAVFLDTGDVVPVAVFLR
nr:hypothetical protein [Bacillota bacterium]